MFHFFMISNERPKVVKPKDGLQSVGPPPPIANKMYQECRYKTELCRNFEESGVCAHGDECLFAHGVAEVKPFRGRHRKFKTQLCTAFHVDGFCSFGPRCSYIHTKPDPAKIIFSVQQRTAKYSSLEKSRTESKTLAIQSCYSSDSETGYESESFYQNKDIIFNEIELIDTTNSDDTRCRLPVFARMCQSVSQPNNSPKRIENKF